MTDAFIVLSVADVKECPNSTREFYSGLDDTVCDETAETFPLQLRLFADFRNQTKPTTSSTSNVPIITATVTITVTAHPKSSSHFVHSSDKALEVGLGVGIPLGLAVMVLLCLLYFSTRRELKSNDRGVTSDIHNPYGVDADVHVGP